MTGKSINISEYYRNLEEDNISGLCDEKELQRLITTERTRADKIIAEALTKIRQDQEISILRANEQNEKIRAEILEKAEREKTLIINEANEQAKKIKVAAYDTGVTDGIRAGMVKLQECIRDLGIGICRIESQQMGFVSAYEEKLKALSIDISSKVLRKKVESDNKEMLELIMAIIKPMKSEKWITIELSRTMIELIEEVKEAMRVDGLSETVRVISTDTPIGTCVVNTQDSVVDASLYTQLNNLKEYFSLPNDEMSVK